MHFILNIAQYKVQHLNFHHISVKIGTYKFDMCFLCLFWVVLMHLWIMDNEKSCHFCAKLFESGDSTLKQLANSAEFSSP